MSLQRHLDPRSARREIEGRAVELLCRLHDETSKSAPDDTVVTNILQDLDVLVADHRREKARSVEP